MILELSRCVHFSCGHKYFNNDFSTEENKKIFGSCYSEHGHGHNYELNCYVTGPVDQTTGMIINLRDLDEILKEVTDLLDHRFLNNDVEHFKTVIPTTENIAYFLFQEIQKKLEPPAKLSRIRLYEYEDLWVDCYG